MGNQVIYNVKTPINNDHGVKKVYVDTKLNKSESLMRSNLDIKNNRMYNLAKPDGDNQPATNIDTDTNFLKLNGDNIMAGPLNMPNNKITDLAPATQDGDAVDYIFLK